VSASSSPVRQAAPRSQTARALRAVRPPAPDPVAIPPRGDDLAIEESEPTTVFRAVQPGSRPAVPGARDRAVLVRLDDARAGQLTSLGGEAVRIGRHQDNQVRLDDDGVSRFHARLSYDGSEHVVEDLDSANGTWVDGKRVTRATLRDGDTLQLGPRVVFRYSLVDSNHERVLRQLYESSIKDALTGAYNRQYFAQRMHAEIAFALRHRGNVSLVLFDLDHFKHINDTHGHPAGDAVLRAVGDTVRARLRAEDVLARYGGEEFAVILRGIDAAGARVAAERLRASISAQSVAWEGQAIAVTISAGCASLAGCAPPTLDALVAGADRALYEAKARGRNRVVSAG
jgi:diguanylate cyclase (GGDEF)-like protein